MVEGAPHTAKRWMINCCVYGVPPSTIVLDNIVAVLRRSPAMVEHHHRHHAVMLKELIYYLDTLLDQEGEGRHRAERVQKSEVPYVRYLIGQS